jgi:hypothetical protein
MTDNKVYIVWDSMYDASIVKIFPSEELRAKWLLQRTGINYYTSEYELTQSAVPPSHFSGWVEDGTTKKKLYVSDEESSPGKMFVSTNFTLTAFAYGTSAEEVEQNALKLIKLWKTNSKYFEVDPECDYIFIYTGNLLNV